MYEAASDRYDDKMKHRRCGASGILLPEISLGFWHNFGDDADPAEAKNMMHHAFDSGITHFDFANNYGPPYGAAERNCGQILKQDFANYRDELIISSKAGHDMWPGPHGEWGSRKHLLASLDQSLKRLQLDYVDIFYSHRPDPNTPLEETMSALHTAVQSGRALYVGLSKYPLEMLKEAVTILKDMGTRCLIYQPPMSIFERGIERDGILPWLHENKIGVIAFSPLAQGMLTDKYLQGIPEKSRATRSEGFLTKTIVEKRHEQIVQLHALAQEHGLSLQHMALKWLLQRQGITSALIGARTVAQLEDNIAAHRGEPLSEELMAKIDRV